MGIGQQDSVGKIIDTYFTAVTKKPFEYFGKTFEPRPLVLMPSTFTRRMDCVKHCGGCCRRFSMDWLPAGVAVDSVRKFLEVISGASPRPGKKKGATPPRLQTHKICDKANDVWIQMSSDDQNDFRTRRKFDWAPSSSGNPRPRPFTDREYFLDAIRKCFSARVKSLPTHQLEILVEAPNVEDQIWDNFVADLSSRPRVTQDSPNGKRSLAAIVLNLVRV